MAHVSVGHCPYTFKSYRYENSANIWSIIIAYMSVRCFLYTFNVLTQLNIALYMVNSSFQPQNVDYVVNICNEQYHYMIMNENKKRL
jgi:hypothetical protein